MDIHKILKERFGFEQFRAGQEDVIRDVIAGKIQLPFYQQVWESHFVINCLPMHLEAQS